MDPSDAVAPSRPRVGVVPVYTDFHRGKQLKERYDLGAALALVARRIRDCGRPKLEKNDVERNRREPVEGLVVGERSPDLGRDRRHIVNVETIRVLWTGLRAHRFAR